MAKFRPLSAEALTIGAVTMTVVGMGLKVVPIERGILFIVGMVAGATFHIISNRTMDTTDTDGGDGDGSTEDGSVSLASFETSPKNSYEDRTSDDPIAHGHSQPRSNDREEKDESASTKPVFGSNGGARGNRRNTGPSNGRR